MIVNRLDVIAHLFSTFHTKKLETHNVLQHLVHFARVHCVLQDSLVINILNFDFIVDKLYIGITGVFRIR